VVACAEEAFLVDMTLCAKTARLGQNRKQKNRCE
jgi:hypothetical protein